MIMKAYELQNKPGFDSLTLVERPEPKPGYDQIVVRVRATSLNYRDLIIARGQNKSVKFPVVPMSDGAGDAIAIGEGVTRVKVGDRVAGIFFQTWLAGNITQPIMQSAMGGEIDGMLAEYVVLNQDGVVILPDNISYEEGATLPCAAVTAWHGLVTKGNLTAGESILVLGTGGVSILPYSLPKCMEPELLSHRAVMRNCNRQKHWEPMKLLTIRKHQIGKNKCLLSLMESV